MGRPLTQMTSVPGTLTAPDRGDRKKDAVCDTLLRRLTSGHYRFGERILVKELAGTTGASRQPIMAALIELQEAGFVVITAQVGCEVVSPSLAEVEDFYLMFGRIEGLIAELASQRQQPGEAAHLRAINRRFASLPKGQSLAYLELNRSFHNALYDIARAPGLHRRGSENWAFSDFLIGQTYEVPPRLRVYALEHEAIIEAIESRDGDAARRAAEAHITSVSRLVRRAMAGAPSA